MALRQKPKSPVPWTLVGALTLITAGLLAFWPALHGDWLLGWDDGFMVPGNPELRDWAGLESIWAAPPHADYWPVTSTFLWIEWHFFGDQPFGYHLCSLGLHILSGFLIWRLLARLGVRWGWLGGLLFVLHPLAVESVAWISEIKNTLSLPLFLLSLLAYLDFERTTRKIDYAQSLGLYLAAMLAKSSVIMLPAVLLLYCWWKRNRITRLDLQRIAPYFGFALLLGLLTVSLQNHQALSDAFKPRPAAMVFLCAGEAIFFYLGHFICPLGLSLIYPRWTFDSPTLLQLLTWPALAALVLLLCAGKKEWQRHVLLGLGFFLLNLFPVIGFFNMTYMRVSWVADHLAYLPIVGLIGLVAAGAEQSWKKIAPAVRPWAIAVVVLLAAGLIFLTRTDAAAFADEETLWTVTQQRNPRAMEAYNNLGLFLQGANRLPEAIAQYQQALRLDPRSAETHVNLGGAYELSGRPDEAIEQFEQGVALKPDYAGMQYDLGTLLLLRGDLPGAIDHLQKAVTLDPHHARAQNNLAVALQKVGRAAEAIPHLRQAVEAQPDYVDAHYGLGLALAGAKQFREAAEEFKIVLQLAPQYPGAADALARAEMLEGQSTPGR